eukprot:comp24811_c0_seq1/m.46889 comp24811_c0_seq1/g.46889  ORF comp24811_c0_seq1/g.46889 comp24811_c0_seq1/m.46889 type:complete len:259 (-) comp24811_c0_seq1:357-1133(-)
MAENLKQFERDETSQAIASPAVPTPAQENTNGEATTVAAPRPLTTPVFARPSALSQRVSRTLVRRPSVVQQTPQQNSYHIRIRSSMGIACRVRVRDTDKISSVILTVSSFTGVPPSRLQLVVRKTGAELRDGSKSLKECNIVDGDVLHMLPRLRAGPLGGYPVFCTLTDDGEESDSSGSSESSLSARLRRLDETQEELDSYPSQETLPGPESSVNLLKDMEEEPVDEQKLCEHENTRKRMLALREKMEQQQNAKRRKL